MLSGRCTDWSLVPKNPTECVCLTECDGKDPGPFGVFALGKRIIQGNKILAGKRKEKKPLGSPRG